MSFFGGLVDNGIAKAVESPPFKAGHDELELASISAINSEADPAILAAADPAILAAAKAESATDKTRSQQRQEAGELWLADTVRPAPLPAVIQSRHRVVYHYPPSPPSQWPDVAPNRLSSSSSGHLGPSSNPTHVQAPASKADPFSRFSHGPSHLQAPVSEADPFSKISSIYC
jgi:hypothetical protein